MRPPPTNLSLALKVRPERWILLSGSIGFLVAYGLGASSPFIGCSAGLACIVTRVALQDLRSFTIADRDQVSIAGLGFLWLGLCDLDPWLLASGGLRAAAFAASFELVRRAYQAMRGRAGLGFGDVKLAGAAGPWLEPTEFACCVGVAAVCGLAFALIRARVRGRPLRRTALLPFGTFLAPALWITWIVTN